jgi:hypothetical protein
MNKDLFESKWKQIEARSKEWWDLINDHDLERVAQADIKLNKYVTMLQVKYGFTRDQAKKEIGIRVAGFEAEQKK